jgi:myosin heavy subunit
MVDQLPEHMAKILDSASLEDLERLVRGIDRRLITELVKRNKYLQQHVFPGFRPDHLPWNSVPAGLAQDAHRPPANNARAALFQLWLDSNSDLCKEVEQAVKAETLEEDIVKLLAKWGPDRKDQLLWTLLIDEREEIQAALASGLRDALTNENSALLVRADRMVLAGQLEKANQEIRNLKEDLSKREHQDRLLNRGLEELGNLREELDSLKDAKKNDAAQYQKELQQKVDELRQTIEEKDRAQQEARELRAALNQEKAHTIELQNDIDNLRASLNTAIASQNESASEVERKLNDTLKLLEDQRRESTSLQQRLTKAEKDKAIAYEKRDEERERREYAESRQEKLEGDKNVLIQQRREDHQTLKQLEEKLGQMQQALSAKEKTKQPLFTLLEVDESWHEAVEELADHLTLLLPSQELAHSPVPSQEKIADWRAWQQTELTFIRPLLEASAPIFFENIVDVERAQKLLVLRWYLLECLKLSLTETLNENNRVKERIK